MNIETKIEKNTDNIRKNTNLTLPDSNLQEKEKQEKTTKNTEKESQIAKLSAKSLEKEEKDILQYIKLKEKSDAQAAKSAAKALEKASSLAEKEEAKELKDAEISAKSAEKAESASRSAAKKAAILFKPVRRTTEYGEEYACELINKNFVKLTSAGQVRAARVNEKNVESGCGLEIFTKNDFLNAFSHEPHYFAGYSPGGKSVYKNPAAIWWDSLLANRATYGTTFNPLETPMVVNSAEELNLWCGFKHHPAQMTIKECADDWALQVYINHTHEVICDGKRNSSDFLIRHLSRVFTQPWMKKPVAVIMRAGQGVGKTAFMQPLLRIAGAHGTEVGNAGDALGSFNSLVDLKCLVFFDEAFANAHETSRALKTAISSDKMIIKRKFLNAQQSPNLMHMFMASNSENVVRIERDDRRYFFVNCSEKYKGKTAYFARLFNAINSKGFCEKLLCFLSHIDTSINCGNTEEPPKTFELTLQKIDSLSPYEYFVYTILQNGEYMTGKGWREKAPNEEYTRAFDEWVHIKKIKGSYGDSPRKVAAALALAGGSRGRERVLGVREYTRIMPPLDDARETFEKSIKGKIDWD